MNTALVMCGDVDISRIIATIILTARQGTSQTDSNQELAREKYVFIPKCLFKILFVKCSYNDKIPPKVQGPISAREKASIKID